MARPRSRTRRDADTAPAAQADPRAGEARDAEPRARRRRARATDAGLPRAGMSALPLSREASARQLVRVMGEQLGSLCHVIERVGDTGTDVDLVLSHLAALAGRPRRPARRGQERAWLLSALLRLLGAASSEPDPRRLPLLRKLRPSPGRIEIRPERLQRLQDALQGITAPERASVVLVVQEGLSLEQASRVLGHSRQEFAEAYSEALDALDDELLETLMGH